MHRHHRALAEADEGQFGIVEPEARELGVEEGVDRPARLDDAVPALLGAARVVGGRFVSANHCRPVGAPGAAFRRMGRDEGDVGQKRAPLPPELDEVVPSAP